jgi:hypothetical protein
MKSIIASLAALAVLVVLAAPMVSACDNDEPKDGRRGGPDRMINCA